MSEENEVVAKPAEQWLEPSPAASDYMRHEVAMEPAGRVPVHKAFAVAPGYNVGMLRKMAEAFKPKRIVVIDHGEQGFEVRRLANNADVSLFYASLDPKQLAEATSPSGAQVKYLKQILCDYQELDDEKLIKYDSHGSKLRAAGCISYSFLHRRCAGVASFKNSAEGATSELKKALFELESESIVQRLDEVQSNELFGINAIVYRINKIALNNA